MNTTTWAAAALMLAATAATPVAADEIGGAVARWQAGAVCPSAFGQGRNAANDIPFIAQTQVIPAIIGMGFGVKAQATQPEGVGNVTITVVHPPFTPGGGNAQSFQTAMSGTGLSGFYYRFEEAREVVPGTWSVQATAGTTLLYRIDFEVVRPRVDDGLLRACGVATGGN